MRILAVDPGTKITGYAILEKQKKKFLLLKTGCLKFKNPKKTSILARLFIEIERLIKNFSPELIITERPFAHRFPERTSSLIQAQGVLLLLGGLFNLPVEEIHPSEIKKIITGNGKASKEDIKTWINTLIKTGILEIREENSLQGPYDVFDAVALGMGYLCSTRFQVS